MCTLKFGSPFAVLSGLVFGLVALTGGLGCRSLGATSGPVGPSPEFPLPPPGEVLKDMRDRAASRQNMRAMGRVTYFGRQGRVRLRAVLLSERPGAFRVELLSPAEEPVGIMTCDGEGLWLLKDRRLMTGPATAENIARLLPMPMLPHEIVDLLLGGLPSSDRFEPVSLLWADVSHQMWRLTLSGPSGDEVHLTIDPTRHVVRSARFARVDRPSMTVAFDDFKPIDGLPGEFPTQIVVQVQGDEDVRIKLESLEVNVTFDSSLFLLTPPSGISPEPM
ncbi:MAG: hypothetical protein IPK13_06905 [Deltaproteobacteria bacterium]|nr:hypothetical protein [Deltaproteobacteria bacterium]